MALLVSGCSSTGADAPGSAPEPSASQTVGDGDGTGTFAWTQLEPTGGAQPQSTHDGGAAGPTSGADATSTPASPSPTSMPTAGASPTAHLGTQHGRGSEGAPSEEPSPFLLPETAPDRAGAPLLAGATRRHTARRNGLFRGYPRRTLPPVPSSRVSSSSLSRQGPVAQVAMSARTTRDAGRVLLFYRTTLGRLGFSEVDDGSAGGLEAMFTRGDEAVSVAVSPGPTGSSYTLFATAEVNP